MIINSRKIEQVFDASFTAENAGKVGLNIANTVKRIKIAKVIGGAVPTTGDVTAELHGDFSTALIGTAGAAGAVTSALKKTSLVSVGTRVIKLNAAAITKTSGLELEFGIAMPPRIGDEIFIEATDPVAKDSSVMFTTLTVIDVTGSKVKLMSEVPSAVALPSTGDLYVKIMTTSHKQPMFKRGFGVSSTSRIGDVVTLKGSIGKIYGADESQGMLQISEDSALLTPIKKKSGNSKAFAIISSKAGELQVRDPDSLIVTKALGTDMIGFAEVVAVGGFTMLGSVVTQPMASAFKTTLIDLSKLTGAVAGDSFKVYAFYGGDI